MKNNYDILKKLLNDLSSDNGRYYNGFSVSKTINPVTKTGMDYVVYTENSKDIFRVAIHKENILYPRYLEDCVFYKNEQYTFHVYLNVPVGINLENTQYTQLVDVGFELINQPVIFTNPSIKFIPNKVEVGGKLLYPGLLDITCEEGKISIAGYLGKHISSKFLTYLQYQINMQKGIVNFDFDK